LPGASSMFMCSEYSPLRMEPIMDRRRDGAMAD
jgi:hypothetical protein